MKEIFPPGPAPIVRNEAQRVQELFRKFVVPSYARFDLAFSRGSGSYLWDVGGKRYLDLGGGIAVCALGHANAEITEALIQQSQRLVHVSNLYYNEPQGLLAQTIVRHLAPGKVFFCNSGAEANEGLYKLARKFGHDEGRFEIITAFNSFHGRTLAGIAATGQDKVKKGFEPMVAGFRHVPYGQLDAVEGALSPATSAILIEAIQGEGGITPAKSEYLLGLRQLCDERKLLLMMDGVQDGHFRTGRFQAFQRILETPPSSKTSQVHEPRAPTLDTPSRSDGERDRVKGTPDSLRGGPDGAIRIETESLNSKGLVGDFLPDALSMAKSLGGGFPMGAFWVRDNYADLLGAGTHATTFGGTPLGCAVALKIFEVIERDNLAANARHTGEFLKAELQRLAHTFPQVLQGVRGLGLMLGLQLFEKEKIRAFASSDKTASLQFVNRLHEAGLLVIPAGTDVVRFLPPLNLTRGQVGEGIGILEEVLKSLA